MANKKESNSAVKTMKVEVFYKVQKCTGKNGNEFTFKKWLTKAKDNKVYQVAFVMEAKAKVPSARAILNIKESDMNWNRKNPQYPVLYIKNIESVEELESAPEQWTNYFEEA